MWRRSSATPKTSYLCNIAYIMITDRSKCLILMLDLSSVRFFSVMKAISVDAAAVFSVHHCCWAEKVFITTSDANLVQIQVNEI
ncbi:hypothetical protein EJB05_06843, partial [Eragrostis curvula]